MSGFSIDELERDLGLGARLSVIASVGGQARYVPSPRNAPKSSLAKELGAEIVLWLSARFSGEQVVFPSRHGAEVEDQASRLRAAVLDAGLTAPTRSADAIASEFGVTGRRVRQVREELRAEDTSPPKPLPLFPDA